MSPTSRSTPRLAAQTRAMQASEAPASAKPPLRPRRQRTNTLNDLSGREWIKSTKSWLICDSRRYARNKDTELHPARYPEELVSEFVLFFTKAGQRVLDPFCGSGATLVACHETGRQGLGVELSGRYVAVCRERLQQVGALAPQGSCQIVQGDARQLTDTALWAGTGWAAEGQLPEVDFIMTSPPYFDMLRKSRGGVVSAHQQRARQGLDTHYSDDPGDVGNVRDYDEYIEIMGRIIEGAAQLLRPRGYAVVVVQNLRDTTGEVRPLAWDLQRRISQSLSFQGERIWCQNSKPLGIWGYPTVFVPNYHHHYCLIFQRRTEQ
jgi:DNA modification methylase